MSLLRELLGAAVIVGSGLTAGVFFAIAVSVMPTVFTLPPDRYVEIHRSLGKGYHPVMPAIVAVVLVVDVALVILSPHAATRALFAVAAACTVGVQLVSQFGNVPINKRIAVVDAAAIPAGWTDPRPAWRFWHNIRTVFAVAALAAGGLAVALAP
ncbi:DUF1772 domain-containing protein [Actinomycetes bacterium KLBMP 9797]